MRSLCTHRLDLRRIHLTPVSKRGKRRSRRNISSRTDDSVHAKRTPFADENGRKTHAAASRLKCANICTFINRSVPLDRDEIKVTDDCFRTDVRIVSYGSPHEAHVPRKHVWRNFKYSVPRDVCNLFDEPPAQVILPP